ncbi:ABC transporter permease [Paenibacillus tepidiphilus]|uniref:ABC transporter permease n=1 Tax=Paenibacillus tepidiphilus TaxID=2608683 RepID=UPI0013A54108|nr:FtsX-like permease family protein [Paenibacillus tepidiphilus]
MDSFLEQHTIDDASFYVQKPIENVAALEEEFNVTIETRKSYDLAYNSNSILRIFNETSKIDTYSILEGGPIERLNDIVIDPSYAKQHSLKIGENTTINGKQYRIAGFITLPDFMYLVKEDQDILVNPETFGIAVISNEAMKDFPDSSTFYSLIAHDGNIKAVKNEINKLSTIIKWVDQTDNMRLTHVNENIKSFIIVGKILPVIILILTCALLAIIMWRLLRTEYVQIGTLYALGYKKSEIIKHYLSYPFVLSISGGLLGTSLGIFLAKPLSALLLFKYNLPHIDIELDYVYLCISLVLPLLFLIPTTFLVVKMALRLSPVTLLRGGANKTKINFLEKKLNMDFFSFNTKFKIRGILRNITRTFILMISITFASLLLLFGFTTNDSMDYMIYDNYTNTLKYNYSYIFNSLQQDRPKDTEILSFAPFEAKHNKENYNFILYGVEKDSKLLSLRDADGNELSKDSVIMTSSLAKKLDIQESESVTLINKLNDLTFKINIDHISPVYTGDIIYIPLSMFNSLNNYPKNSFMEVISNEKLETDKTNILSFNDKSEQIEGYQTFVKPIRYMVGVVALISFVIGLIIIYVITTMIIEENKASISLLKILGYSKQKVSALILNSNIFVVIIGYCISIPLINQLMDLFFKAAFPSMAIPTKLEFKNIVIGFLIILVTYEVSKYLSKKKVMEISMADSLKSRVE